MEQKNIHWFPGHMVKALREIEERMAIVDIVIEICDARAPLSSRNPFLAKIRPNKKRLLILAKADLADSTVSERWIRYFEAQGTRALALDIKSKRITPIIQEEVNRLVVEKREREIRKGMRPQPVRVMVLGVPNVGKSTFINTIANRNAAAVENRPGLTKAQQWIKVGNDFELLDTPGILPAHYEEKETTMHLAAIGAIKQEILPLHEIASFILTFIRTTRKQALLARYELAENDLSDISHLFELIAQKRGLLSGGNPDMDKADISIIGDFRNGSLGRFSLEEPTL